MSCKSTFPETLWAGTEHSLTVAMEAYHRLMEAGLFDQEDDEDEKPDNVTLQGNIGIVSIKGPLTNRDHWANACRGITSYGDVRRGLLYAASNPEVKAILLDIDSGGGAVSGVADTGNLISLIDTKVKPVYAFTDGAMCSAAYWLGCSARQVFSSNVSTVGSIGVIATHMEQSKMLKEMGIGVTVVRAGEYKALANSMEPLSDKALAQLQGQLNAAYQVFLEHVAANRNVTVDQCDRVMAQGREFFGKEALGAGLVDGVETFDTVMSRIELTFLDNGNISKNNPSNFQRGGLMGKQALTEQEIAALASGAKLDAGGGNLDMKVEDPAPAPVEAETSADPAKDLTETQKETVNSEAAVVSFLKGQAEEKDRKILAQAVEIKGLTDKVAAMQNSHQGLMAIARKSLSNMKIALGFSGVDVSGLSVEALLAEHGATAMAFANKFKAGGVGAVDAAADKGKDERAPMDAVTQARLAAVRFSK